MDEKPEAGNQKDKLPDCGTHHIYDSISKTGCKITAENGNRRKCEGNRNNSECGNTECQHFRTGGKKTEQLSRKELKQHGSQQDNADSGGYEDVPCLTNPFQIPVSIVITNDGDGSLPQSIGGHHKKVLQFIVDTKKGDGRRGNIH